MRDAQSALDQVMAFGGAEIDATTVSEVLGLVERDVLLDLLDVVADEDAARVFDVAGRLVESGHDLRHVCRELARLVRDLMVLQVDPARTEDPEFAIEGDGERLRAIASRFSREDLLRAFELVAKLEQDVKVAAQPRFHLEMALLRWVHLRKLVPLTALLDGLPGGGGLPAPALAPRSAPPAPARPMARPPAGRPPRRLRLRVGAEPAARAAAHVVRVVRRKPAAAGAGCARGAACGRRSEAAGPPAPRNLLVEDVSESALARFREAFLGEVKRSRGQADWGMVFLPARRVEVAVGSVTFVYESQPKLMAGALRGAASRAERAGDEPGRPSDGGLLPRRGRPGGRGADGAAGRKGSAQGRGDGRARRADAARRVPGRHPRRRRGEGMNIQQMMKQAAKMQDQVQKQAAQARAEGTAGGGAVTIVINGLKQVQSLTIDPEVVNKDDVEILQDMIIAAFVDAQKKVDEDMKKQMGGLLGGMGLPGF